MAEKQLPPLMKASELAPVSFYTTGILELDNILKPKGSKKPGGFPVGRVTEIYGMEGVGKTSVTLQSIAGMQKAGLKTLFVDAENALNTDRAAEFGVDLNELMVSTETIAENITNLILAYVKHFDIIVVDSVAAIGARDEYDDDEAGGAYMGLKARIMGQMMRKVIKPLADNKCSLVFINQERMNLQPFGKKTFTPGGKAIPYATSLRIELKSGRVADKIMKTTKGEKHVGGQWVTAIVRKTKVGTPDAEAKFKLMY